MTAVTEILSLKPDNHKHLNLNELEVILLDFIKKFNNLLHFNRKVV